MDWISIERKFPESDKLYLVMIHHKFISISYYYEDSFGKHWSSEWDVWDHAYDDTITHWMPLPDKPVKCE